MLPMFFNMIKKSYLKVLSRSRNKGNQPDEKQLFFIPNLIYNYFTYNSSILLEMVPPVQ